ncbi:MAG: hypothetical protein DRH04_03260 [Deltaproteobacteria bacterium]|nr:MAG: hypothetical protein DRH04_03260 [Deltaproteobacteria bacterium]
MSTVACIIARTNSTRLPRKVLKKINNLSMIEIIIKRIKKCREVDSIYVCTSTEPDDRVLLEIAAAQGIKSYAGSPDAVIERMLSVAEMAGADNLVRITGDNIFTDQAYLDIMISCHRQQQAEYTRTEYLPIGVTAEVMSSEALARCAAAIPVEYTQYLMLYMFQPERYRCLVLKPEDEHCHPSWSLTVDTPEDWERTEEIILQAGTPMASYAQINRICSTGEIPSLIYEAGAQVNFPAGIQLCYQSFRMEMEQRITRAIREPVSREQYHEAINE